MMLNLYKMLPIINYKIVSNKNNIISFILWRWSGIEIVHLPIFCDIFNQSQKRIPWEGKFKSLKNL